MSVTHSLNLVIKNWHPTKSDISEFGTMKFKLIAEEKSATWKMYKQIFLL